LLALEEQFDNYALEKAENKNFNGNMKKDKRN
jgi:hypothetical protein